MALTCLAGVLPSREMVLGLYGPEPVHEAEALAKTIIATFERLTAQTGELDNSTEVMHDLK